MDEIEFYQFVGSRLKAFRSNKKMRQDEFSVFLKISRPSIANMEAGRQPIQLYMLYRLSEGLDVQLDELLIYLFRVEGA